MTALNDCGCCEGLTVETPVAVSNRPGLSGVAYRVGTHARFKASMLARLSGSDVRELANLKTRDEDDFTIGLLDAFAVVADVLTFYQERIANEAWLRTATERQSVIELARLIGYELRPGVAASTYLAFTTETGVGAPSSIELETGLRVQSVPGPGEKPQTYETVETIEARPEWNALQPRLAEVRMPRAGDTSLIVAGVTSNLRPGDTIVIAGQERIDDPKSDLWQFRRLSAVEPDTPNARTVIRWSDPLENVPQRDPRVYALRLRASLFGYNAVDWLALPVALRIGEKHPTTGDLQAGAFSTKQNEWADTEFGTETTAINLDAVYPQVVPGSWLVLASASTVQLYGVNGIAEEALTQFNMSGKTTRVTLDGVANIDAFSPRNAGVHAHSEELTLAGTPLREPVWREEIPLDRVAAGLQKGRTLLFSGRRMRVTVVAESLQLTSADGRTSVQLSRGDSLIVAALPEDAGSNARWRLIDENGFDGFVEVPVDRISLAASKAGDPVVMEVATLEEAMPSSDNARTILRLAAPLRNVFDRPTVTIFANVALATHGETVQDEILGSGDAGRAYQHFTLKEAPLTHTAADTASGGTSTLQVRVNDLLWNEVETLHGRGPRERVYVTNIDDGGTTTVQFGDGRTGARLPAGSENVKATYRKGIGLEGLVNAGQLTLLMTRPLGLRGVTNPAAPAGAQDPQALADARTNAPVTVLTLDRIVSLQDFEDFARAFSGISKALATWTWSGHTRQVFITVAGIGGASVEDGSVLHTSLVSAMQKAGDVFVPISVRSYSGVTFRVEAAVRLDPAFIQEKVLAAIESSLRAAFSFDARSFGQAVTLSEVIAVMQDVAGVVAVDINKLYRTDDPDGPSRETFLPSFSPGVGAGPATPPAELLSLDPGPLLLTVMP